jgi:hypothetical protein
MYRLNADDNPLSNEELDALLSQQDEDEEDEADEEAALEDAEENAPSA